MIKKYKFGDEIDGEFFFVYKRVETKISRSMRKILLGISILFVQALFMSVNAQVKVADDGVTKVYQEGTRITYFEMSNFPNSPEVREFVSKMLLENPDVHRVILYEDGFNCMFDAKENITPYMVVDAINEALSLYREEVGDYNVKVGESKTSVQMSTYTVKEDAGVVLTPNSRAVKVQPQASRPNSKSDSEVLYKMQDKDNRK